MPICARLCRRAAEFGIALMIAVQGTFAFGFSQEEITTAALNTFNNASATFDWNTYLNQYLNGVAASNVPQYEAGQLAWGETYAAMAQRAMFDATGDAQHVDLLLHSAETMYANRADRLNPALNDHRVGIGHGINKAS